MTQKDRVIQYIRDFGSISRKEAFNDLGVCELSARICELEKIGFRFARSTETGKNRYGDPVSYTRYTLED